MNYRTSDRSQMNGIFKKHMPAIFIPGSDSVTIAQSLSPRSVGLRDVLRIGLRGADTLAVHAEDAPGSVQGTAFRTRDHHSVRSAVSPVFTQLSRSGKVHGRAQSER
jgi:hypothetical protein